jgi:hypothetical protein
MLTAAAAEVTLPDDVVRDILRRVEDDTALFRCAMACKRWRVLVADPSFLRPRWPEDAPTLVGFFALQKDRAKPVFVPAAGSPIISGRRSLSSFCREGAAADLLDTAVPLTSRRGLLLVRIPQGGPNQLAVCNILAGTCDMLPPLNHNVDFDITNYTILTAADCSSEERRHMPLSPGYSSFFRVFVVGLNSHGARNQYYLLTFSSGESGWTAPRECPNHDDDISHVYKRGGAVVCRGTAHWLFTGRYRYTLDVSADTGRVSLTKLVFLPSHFRWCSSGARLLSIAFDGTLIDQGESR